jgi:hypothetical protein
LEISESTQQQLDSTLENAVNANEVKHQEPIGVVPLSFALASEGMTYIYSYPWLNCPYDT